MSGYRYAYRGSSLRFVVEVYHDLVPALAGITMREFFKDKDKCAAAWRAANAKLADYFGPVLPLRHPGPPPLSYGHLVCLGAPLRCPEDAEPNISPFAGSLDEAIAILEEKRGMDFAAQPIVQEYMEIGAALRRAFPEEQFDRLSACGMEGPLTSAALMRGHDFYMELLDEPDKTARFLSLMTDSVIDYVRFLNRVNGRPEKNPRGAGLADDLASMVPPSLWDELVVPFWRRYYQGVTDGQNWSLHCEALVPSQLPYLKKAGVTRYQPSVSPALTIDTIRQNTDLPFDWLLYAYHLTEMDDAAIAAWVDETVEKGIDCIRTQFGAFTVRSGKLDRILAFYKAAEKYRV